MSEQAVILVASVACCKECLRAISAAVERMDEFDESEATTIADSIDAFSFPPEVKLTNLHHLYLVTSLSLIILFAY